MDPEVPEAGVDDLWCAVTTPASDDDGDTLSYTITWTKNGSSFTGTTTTVYTNDTVPYTATSASDTFACRVTASDGSATSAAATDSVSVLGRDVHRRQRHGVHDLPDLRREHLRGDADHRSLILGDLDSIGTSTASPPAT
jgi:hypothetical protein